MCEPVSITAGVLGVAGGISQGRAARQQARGQAAYQAQQEAVNHANYEAQTEYQQRLMEFQTARYLEYGASTSKSLSNQFGAVLENVEQTQLQATQKMSQINQKTAASMAFTSAAAAESGVQGSSIQQAMNQYQAAEAQSIAVETANLKGALRQRQRNLTAYRAAAQNALNRAQPAPLAPINLPAPGQPVSQPSMTPYLISGLSQGISAGVGTYDVMRNL
tara:strand:+ start:1585 stop:2244 length:660 start_codon:yes stop_codon:yes gene_type:complete